MKLSIWANHNYDSAVRIRHRRERYKTLLQIAADPERDLRLHCQGGRAYKGDVKDLVQNGFLKLTRKPYGLGWARDLRHPYQLRRTVAEITPAGQAFLEKLS